MVYKIIGKFDREYFWGVMLYPDRQTRVYLGMPSDEFPCWEDDDFRRLELVPHGVGQGLMDFLETYPEVGMDDITEFALKMVSDVL